MRLVVPLLLLLPACQFELLRGLGPGELRGRLVYVTASEDKVPAEGAFVTLEGSPTRTRADARGLFVFRELPEGRHVLAISYDEDDDGVPDGGLRVKVELRRTATGAVEGRDLGTIIVSAFGGLAGRVLRGDEAVQGARVVVAGVVETIAETGGFSFDRVAAGEYSVTALVKEGTRTLVAAPRTVHVAPRVTTVVDLDLAAGALAESGTVQGFARRAGAAKHDGITVSLLSAGAPIVVGQTAAGGRYESGSGLPAGVYTLSAEAADRRRATLPFFVVAGDTEAPDLLLLEASGGCALGGAEVDDADTDLDGTPDADEDPSCVCDSGAATDIDDDGLCDSVDPDLDGDGIDNALDNCRQYLNADQADRDGDGTGDACEVPDCAPPGPCSPSDLGYPGAPFVFTQGQAASPVDPVVTGSPTEWAVAPALPAGLAIDPGTGRLSGTPTVERAAVTYTVTASNAAGSTTAALGVTVVAPAPSALAYPGSPFAFTEGVAIDPVEPSVIGTPDAWSVAPALPAGLLLDGATGRLSGTPADVGSAPGYGVAADYTVTASTSGGSTTATISITIVIPPPTELSYPGAPFTFTKGVAIDPVDPAVTGSPTSWAVVPDLPDGLQLDPDTGTLSGTPTVLAGAAIHLVTAANAGGQTSFALDVAVVDVPPAALSYPGDPFALTQGVALSVDPVVTGTPTSWAVSPDLPAGLAVDGATGRLAGTPTAVAPASDYTVTAANSGGSTTAVLSIAVLPVAPSDLSYPGSPFTFVVGAAITPADPVVTGAPTSWSVAPALPAGLSLVAGTGRLAGAPTATGVTSTYTVTAANVAGSATFALSITVVDPPPEDLAYPGAPFAFTAGAPIVRVDPTYTGTVETWSVSPALPGGLSINPATGRLDGTPSAPAATADYTVTASNSGGSATCTFSITIGIGPPSGLGYPGGPFVFPRQIEITPVEPVVTGTVDTYSVSPDLPPGLVLDTGTGQLSGTPSTLTPAATYTVTASNAAGSTTADLTISVSFMRPFAALQPTLQAAAALGSTGAETFTNIALPGGGDLWIGGVLAPNGNIFGFLDTRLNVLRIDPVAGTALLLGALSAGGFDQWPGGVLAPNGLIYSLPQSQTSVLVTDPDTGASRTVPITPFGSSQWTGSVVAPNGKIYGCPRGTPNVLVVDPADDSTHSFAVPSSGYVGGVLAPNGKIYCMPNSATTVLVIDPDAESATTIGPVPSGYWGGVLGPNGKIYAIPGAASQVLVIDPSNDTATTLPTNLGTTASKWFGGALAPNGRIYGMPRNSPGVLVIDTADDSVTTTFSIAGTNKWYGGILAPNGKIYGIPQATSSVLVLDTKSLGSWPADVYLSPYFNKL